MDKIVLDKWINPDQFAQLIANNYNEAVWAYLKSGQSFDIKNSKSIIALFPIEEIINKVGHSERTDAVIEPRLSLQWFASWLTSAPLSHGVKLRRACVLAAHLGTDRNMHTPALCLGRVLAAAHKQAAT